MVETILQVLAFILFSAVGGVIGYVLGSIAFEIEERFNDWKAKKYAQRWAEKRKGK